MGSNPTRANFLYGIEKPYLNMNTIYNFNITSVPIHVKERCCQTWILHQSLLVFIFVFKFTFGGGCCSQTQGLNQGSSRNGSVFWQVAHYKKVQSQASDKASFLTPHINYAKMFLKLYREYEESQRCVAIVISYHYWDRFRRTAYIHSPAKKVCLQCHFLCEFVRPSRTEDFSMCFFFLCISAYANFIWSTLANFSFISYFR